MSAIVPPLDYIPKLPGKAVAEAIKLVNRETSKLFERVSKTVQDSTVLPDDIKCDDPRIIKIKEQLAEIQLQLTKVNQTVPKIQTAIDKVKQAVTVAQGIKTAVSIAQLSNPVTAPVFIANQLIAVQDATIVNAIESLNQFAKMPATLTSKLATIVGPLEDVLSKIANSCENVDISGSIELPQDVLDSANSSNNNDYNDLVTTDFYTEFNVSDDDILDRSNAIEQLLTQQSNLLMALQEAPSKVYQSPGEPALNLGKVGDYYIDTQSSVIYGPKPTATSWGQPINQ